MPYGKLTDQQARVVAQHVAGREVHDLGAGDLALASQLLTLGATTVSALDRNLPRKSPDPRIFLTQGYFHQYRGDIEVAFVSWPCNWQDRGLTGLLRRTPLVIYVGKNTDGTVCGGEDFWRSLQGREVLAYLPAPDNSLIVYGPRNANRPLLGEEWAGLETERIVSYEELEAYPVKG